MSLLKRRGLDILLTLKHACIVYRYMIHLNMIKTFQDKWLDDYYFIGEKSHYIQSKIENALRRKLDIVHAAKGEKDLRVPPGNQFEHLKGKLKGWCSIRVNKQYRLIFQWDSGVAYEVFLDPHKYK